MNEVPRGQGNPRRIVPVVSQADALPDTRTHLSREVINTSVAAGHVADAIEALHRRYEAGLPPHAPEIIAVAKSFDRVGFPLTPLLVALDRDHLPPSSLKPGTREASHVATARSAVYALNGYYGDATAQALRVGDEESDLTTVNALLYIAGVKASSGLRPDEVLRVAEERTRHQGELIRGNLGGVQFGLELARHRVAKAYADAGLTDEARAILDESRDRIGELPIDSVQLPLLQGSVIGALIDAGLLNEASFALFGAGETLERSLRQEFVDKIAYARASRGDFSNAEMRIPTISTIARARILALKASQDMVSGEDQVAIQVSLLEVIADLEGQMSRDEHMPASERLEKSLELSRLTFQAGIPDLAYEIHQKASNLAHAGDSSLSQVRMRLRVANTSNDLGIDASGLFRPILRDLEAITAKGGIATVSIVWREAISSLVKQGHLELARQALHHYGAHGGMDLVGNAAMLAELAAAEIDQGVKGKALGVITADMSRRADEQVAKVSSMPF